MKNKIIAFRYEIVLFVILMLLRSFDLGKDNFNTDAWKWKVRSYNFLNAVTTADFAGTYQTYHPGYPLMVLGSSAVVVYNNIYELLNGQNPPDTVETVIGLHTTQKLFVVIVISFLLVISFYILRQLVGLKIALITLLFLTTEPFFLSHTREFHLEGLMTAFMFTSFCFLMAGLLNSKQSEVILLGKRILNNNLLISCFFCALAVLTKSSALFMPAFICLVIVVKGLLDKRSLLKEALNYWFLVAMVIFALWPALWVGPLEVIQKYYEGAKEIGLEGDHIQLYFGKVVTDPGPLFYPLNLVLRLSPEILLVFIISFFYIRKTNGTVRKMLVSALSFVVLYVLFLTIPTKKLDRYIVPVFPFISLAFAIVIAHILTLSRYKLYLGLLALLVVSRLYILAQVHPDYLFYYSPIAGGPSKGIYIVEPKWAFAGVLLGQKLNELAGINEKKVVALPEKYFAQLWPFISQKSVIMDIRRESNSASYFVFPVWEDKYNEQGRELRYKTSVFKENVAIYNIYETSPIP